MSRPGPDPGPGAPGASAAAADALAGVRAVGHFELRDVIGRGGVGVIHRAWDTHLEREVALKFLDAKLAAPGEAREWMLAEARAASRLNHPGIVTVHELGEFADHLYIAMELLAGETLRDRLRRGPVEPAEGLSIARQAAEALRCAHAGGVEHRDFKPANVMLLPDGRVKVLDFGLARVGGRGVLPRAGELSGTPAYMSPEQLRGREPGLGADVWAFGVVAYEMFAGRPCFARATVGATTQAVLYGDPEPLERLAPAVPPAIVALVTRCLAKDASQRPAGMAEVLAVLDDGPAAAVHSPARPGGTRLPAETSSFVGRERELAELDARLGMHRLVTLTGPGGSGKTRLALQVARAREPAYRDGAVFVDLAPLHDPAQVPRRIADAFAVRVPAGRDAEQELLAHAQGREALLVLDNAEQVVEGVAELAARLLARAPSLAILVTSQEALLVAGESAFVLPPLALPDADGPADPEILMASEAVQLFVERAATASPAFRLTAANAAAVLEICRGLDGIPLALELAAARVNTLGVQAIATRLQDRFRLLTSGSRSAVPRQQTLHATIQWSHELLSDPEQVVYRRLAAFVGGWTLEAAGQVAGGAPLVPEDVMDVLDWLVRRSLVVLEGEGADARYRFLESIRVHALEKLDAAGDREAADARHRAWCLRFAAEARATLTGEHQGETLRRLEAEHGNLLAALDRAQGDPTAAAAQLGTAWRLASFWSTRGHVREGRARLEAALARTEAGDGDERVQGWLALGMLARLASDLPAAERAYARALELANALGLRSLAGRARNGFGTCCHQRSDFRGAAEHFEAALAIQRELGESEGRAALLGNLAAIALERGELDRAAALYEESLAETRASGDVRQAAVALYNLGYLGIARGDTDAAVARLDEAIAQFRALGHRPYTALATMSLGKAWLDAGDRARGEALLHEALAMGDRLGDLLVRGHTRAYLGEAALAAGDPALARERLLASLAVFREVGSASDVCDVLERFVRVLALEGRHAAAARLVPAVERLRGESGHPLNPSELGVHAAVVREIEAHVDPATRADARAAAAAMTLDDAESFARVAPGDPA